MNPHPPPIRGPLRTQRLESRLNPTASSAAGRLALALSLLAPPLQATEPTASDLLQAGTVYQDPTLTAARELSALATLLPPSPAASPRSNLQGNLEAAYGSTWSRLSSAYTPGNSATALYQESHGSSLDLQGALRHAFSPGPRLHASLEGQASLRLLPYASSQLGWNLQSSLLFPLSLRPRPAWRLITPLLRLSSTHSPTQALTRLEPGLAAGSAFRLGPLLTGWRTQLLTSAWWASATETEPAGNQQTLTLHSSLEPRGSLALTGFGVLGSSERLLRLGLTAGLARDDQLTWQDADDFSPANLSAVPWLTRRLELALGARAQLGPPLALGLNVTLEGALSGEPEADPGLQRGLGGSVWLEVHHRRLEGTLGLDLRWGESQTPDRALAAWAASAHWGLTAGCRF